MDDLKTISLRLLCTNAVSLCLQTDFKHSLGSFQEVQHPPRIPRLRKSNPQHQTFLINFSQKEVPLMLYRQMGLTIRWREEKNLKKIFDFLIHLGKYGLCSIAYIKNECGWRAILNTNEYSNKGGGLGVGGGGGITTIF